MWPTRQDVAVIAFVAVYGYFMYTLGYWHLLGDGDWTLAQVMGMGK